MKRVVLAALILSGCAAPQANTSLVPIPANLRAFTAGPFGTPAGQWWTRRTADPGLARLIDAALAASPDLAAASARIAQARATLRARRADRTVSVGGSTSLNASRQSAAEGIGGNLPPGISIDRDRVTGRIGVDASYDFDLFGRLAADARAAAARIDAATADAAAVRLALMTDVARNYVAAAAAGAGAGVATENIATARDLVAITRVRVRAGLVAGIDETRRTSLLAEVAATLPPLERERAVRIAALTTLTGLSPVEIAPLFRSTPAGSGLGAPAGHRCRHRPRRGSRCRYGGRARRSISQPDDHGRGGSDRHRVWRLLQRRRARRRGGTRSGRTPVRRGSQPCGGGRSPRAH